MLIRAAHEEQYDAVRAFYHALIDSMRASPYDIGWEKDVYPAPEFLRESIERGELYVGSEGDEITAAMVLNGQGNEGYRHISWPTAAEDEEALVIHALGVQPECAGRGYAKELVRHALRIAAEQNKKVVRLDVLAGNVPAERLYAGLGFHYIDTIQMYYDDTGWTDYELYEYPLCDA